MFQENREEFKFDWSHLGDIEVGRPNLGNTTHVAVYRLMQYTLRDAIVKHTDSEMAIEKADLEKLEFTLTVDEDLDCSGLPMIEEAICTYDEGFLSGILETFTNRPFEVKEVDCWCTGDRTCRFTAKAVPR
jgi:predicted hydrocarbon binding protein